MGLLELIEQKSFLGREFLTWIWFRSESDARIDLDHLTTSRPNSFGVVQGGLVPFYYCNQ